MTLFDLVAKLTLDSSEYEQGLDGARGKANKFAKGLNSAADKVLKVGGAAAGVAVAGMTAFAKSAISTGQQFDAAMSQVAATMGVSVDEIQDLRDFAQKMGAETAFSANEAAQALNYMALAGYDAKTSMKMLPNVLNLAAAGGMDLALASDMITDSQSALGLSLDETGELVDKMAKAASKSNTSVSQLGDAILTVGGTAKSMKGGTTELATALGILADNGIKGSEGGTALRNILNSLTAPGDKAAKLMKKLGVSTFDSEGNMRSLNDIFLDLRGSLDSMSQADRANVISTIFNARDMKSAEALIANVGGRWSELSGYIEESQGAAKKMADTQLDNLTGDVTLMKSALEGAKIALSNGLAPAIRKVVQMLTKALSRPKTQKFLKSAGESLGRIITRLFPKVISLLDNGAKKLKIFGAVIAGVVLAIKATVNPIGALISGLGLLAGGLAIASLSAESMAEKADKLEHKFSGLTDAQWDSIEASKENADTFDDLKESRAESFASIDQETERVEDLWRELQKITDENGNVKQSDQERADYILGELSDALGEEYTRNGNIIEQYQTMQKEMDKLISKRHATKLLEAGEEVYYNAKESYKENAKSLAATEQRVASAQEQLDYLESQARFGKALPVSIAEAKLALDNAKKDLADFQKLEEDYLVEIEKYESASAASSRGHYQEVEAIYAKDSASRWKYIKSAKDISAEQLKNLADDLNAQSELFDRHQKGLAEKRKGYSKKMLSDISEDEYDMLLLMAKAVKEAETRGEEVPRAYYDAIKKAANDLNIPTVGANLVDGIINGMNSRSSAFMKRAKFLVKDALTAMKDVAGIKSPSKVTAGYGAYMGEGLIKGLNSTEQSAERAASNYMDSVLSTMDESANYGGINGRSAYSGGNSIMTEIRNLLQDIRENLGFDVVLSDGTIAGRIDKILGTRSLQKARGN